MAKDKKKKKKKKKDKKVEHAGITQVVRRDDAPAYLIQRTSRLLRVLFLRIVQSEGNNITPEMWMVLSRLLIRDGQYQNELADATFRDRPNLSRIVVGLEERGLVTRRGDEGDRRRVRVYLTRSGRDLVHDTAPARDPHPRSAVRGDQGQGPEIVPEGPAENRGQRARDDGCPRRRG